MVATALAVGGSIASGLIGSNAAKKAAAQQAAAIDRATALQQQMYNQNRQDMMPWLDAGRQALASLQGELGTSYEASKGYQWQLGEGQKSVLSNLSALGMTNSGAALKALNQYGQGLAAQDYDKWYNRMQSIASGGQSQSQAQSSLGQNYANAVGNLMSDRGAVQASGTVGQANAWQNSLGQISKALGGMGGGSTQALGYRQMPIGQAASPMAYQAIAQGLGGLY